MLNIRTWADVRAFLYAALPTVATLLVTYGFLDDEQAVQGVGLATAILGPVLAAFHTPTGETVRKALYALLGAVPGVLLVYGVVTQVQLDNWIPVVIALLGLVGGGVASANTPTTAPLTGRHAAG